MTLNITREIAALHRMAPRELRARYAEVFGEPTRSGNRQQLTKRIAWRLQSLAEGGLTERARRRARDLARDADMRLKPPRSREEPAGARTISSRLNGKTDDHLPPPGTVITREYKGRKLCVTVLEDGFEFEGEIYRSISAVAKAITGSHLSGVAFFKLNGRK